MTGRAATATEEALHHERRVQDMAILCLSRKKKEKKVECPVLRRPQRQKKSTNKMSTNLTVATQLTET